MSEALETTSVYDTDLLVWAETQAALLRRLAAGERPNGLDWENIAEEIEDVGRSLIAAVEGVLLQSLVHDLKAEGWPLAPYVEKWRAEAKLFRAQASLRFAPSMRQRIDIAELYANALRAMPDTVDGQKPLPVPPTCPVTLEALLEEAGV